VAYLPGLCFIGLLGAPRTATSPSTRQGFLLLLVEIVIAIALVIYDGSVGMIPVVGFLVGALLKFILWMSVLALTVYGVVKGASGEMARIPILGDAVEKVRSDVSPGERSSGSYGVWRAPSMWPPGSSWDSWSW
jgi:uncharacterized membrane protein